ncbi:MAG: hypothetical protein ACRDLL_01865 [Solirubrobacterales bacterium]
MSASFDPKGDTMAVVEAQGGPEQARSSVHLLQAGSTGTAGRRLLTLPRRVTGVTWSPGGRRLLVGWPDADQWLFLNPTGAPGGQHITAVSNVSRQFEPGGRGSPSFPRPSGWCCTR